MIIDTHIHLDGTEFDADRDDVIARARAAGVEKMFVPAIDLPTSRAALDLSRRYPRYVYPMAGLHPEEVKDGYKDTIRAVERMMTSEVIAVGEVGLDFYWSRDNEREQLEAFEEQVCIAVLRGLPLMIHCRKAQNELTAILRRYEKAVHGGVFHCFTGNATEAAELLRFDGFALGIGGVLTFKKSKLPDVLPHIPLSRVVLETDSPYMAPVPMRGKRNESAFLPFVVAKMSESYGVPADEIERVTTDNARRIFNV